MNAHLLRRDRSCAAKELCLSLRANRCVVRFSHMHSNHQRSWLFLREDSVELRPHPGRKLEEVPHERPKDLHSAHIKSLQILNQ